MHHHHASFFDAAACPTLVADVASQIVDYNAELDILLSNPGGLAVIAASIASVSAIVINGKRQIRQLKEELTARGVDLTFVNDRIDALTFLQRALNEGNVDAALEVCAAVQAERDVLFGSLVDVNKWRLYYKTRGVALETLNDLPKVRAYAAACEQKAFVGMKKKKNAMMRLAAKHTVQCESDWTQRYGARR